MTRQSTTRKRTLADHLFSIAFIGFLLYVAHLWWTDQMGAKISEVVAWLEQIFT